MDEGLSLKRKVIVDYERYNCCIDTFKGILKGLRHDDILNGCFSEFSAIVIN